MSELDPRTHVRDLCRRYGVPADFGRRLLPLVERSRRAGDEMQRRILGFVERSFAAERDRRAAEKARRASSGRPPGNGPRDARALRTVAGVLHAWSPPEWLERWAEHREDGASGDSEADRSEPG